MRSSKPALKLFSALFAFLLFFSFTKAVRAEPVDCNNPELAASRLGKSQCTFEGNRLSQPIITIRRTILDAVTTMLLDVTSQLAFGRNFDQLQVCIALLAPDLNISATQDPTDDCSDLRAASVVTGKYGFPTQYRSTGSLMGMTTILEDVTRNEPLPVNLAYYGKYMAGKVPVLNQTAFAADVDGGPFSLQLVLKVWEKMRNLAYGALAVFMLAIGVMVMLRQKINPQTVITVQAAIPRVIIAVILITFSYPIAAFAIQLILPLSAMAIGLLQIPAAYSGLPASVALVLPVVMGVIGIPGAGLLVLIGIIMCVVIIILLIKVVFKIFLSYVKIIFSVLTAPITFAWGAIPGNELATVNWLKTLVVNIISVPIMFFGIGLAIFVAIELALAVSNSLGGGTLGGFSSILGGSYFLVLGIPLIIVVILLETGKAPEKLDEAILGREKKPHKKS